MGRSVRIGSVGYLNAKPLTVAIDRSRYEVEERAVRGRAPTSRR